MKKSKLFLLISFALFYSSGCKKETNTTSVSDQSLIGAAKDYFEQTVLSSKQISTIRPDSYKSNKRKLITKKPLWNKAYTINLSTGLGIVVPLEYKQKFYFQSTFNISSIYNFDDAARLLIYKDSKKQYHTEVSIITPDSNYKNQSAFSGIISIEDWNGNLLNEYKYASGKIQVLKSIDGNNTSLENSTEANNSEPLKP